MSTAASSAQEAAGSHGSGSTQGGRSLSFATPRPGACMLRAYSDGSAGALGVDFDAGAAGEGTLNPRPTLGAGAGTVAGAGAGGDTDPRSVAGAHSGISAARSRRALLARGASFNRRPTGSGIGSGIGSGFGGVGGSGLPTARGSAAGRNSSSEAAIGVISIHGGDAGVGADGTVSCGSALTSTDGGAPVPYDAEADAADHAASACSPTRRIPGTFAFHGPCTRRACGCQPGPGGQASCPSKKRQAQCCPPGSCRTSEPVPTAAAQPYSGLRQPGAASGVASITVQVAVRDEPASVSPKPPARPPACSARHRLSQ